MTHGNFECNKMHIAIIYGSKPCPLCASHKEIAALKGLLRDIRDELGGGFPVSMIRKVQHALEDT